MNRKFAGQLELYLRQAGLPLRRVASQAGIPHQTIFNWAKGSQPRWYAALPQDLQRLGNVLGLNDDEITLLQRLAGCLPAQSGLFSRQEFPMSGNLHVPKGWFITGDAPEKYEIGLDPEATFDNHPCITLRAGADATEFAALAQIFKAEAYCGKRLYYSAAIRAVDVENRAALFMRVSSSDGRMLAFDNMRNRPIVGTQEWTRYAIVLDVADDAEDILFGILLSLRGQVWMADVNLKTVEKDVPTTDLLSAIATYFPINLGFEE